MAFKEEVQEQGFVPEAPPVKNKKFLRKIWKTKIQAIKRDRTDRTSRCISQPRFD